MLVLVISYGYVEYQFGRIVAPYGMYLHVAIDVNSVKPKPLELS